MEMELAVKLAIYFLIISTEIDYLMARPILERKRRQVVQPTWLINPEIFVDPNVRVTNQNLKETAAIRENIQSAVAAGTFAVDTGGPKGIPVVDSSETSKRPLPFFPTFEFPKFSISQWNFQFFPLEQKNPFTDEMQRIWQEFVENSKKLMNLGSQKSNVSF